MYDNTSQAQVAMKPPSDRKLPYIGISLGDMNGIGPEVIIKTLSDDRFLAIATPIIYGSAKIVSFYRKQLEAESFSYHQLLPSEAFKPGVVNVVNCWEENVVIRPGKATEEAGKYAFLSLEQATDDLLEGRLDALVTAPINKKTMQQESFEFPGHTEYLISKSQQSQGLMLMISENLRIGVVTGHIPLSKVATSITEQGIRDKLRILTKSLQQDFNIIKPKIAVLGLNPHSGDQGLLGNEEQELLEPLLNDLKNNGQLVFGPFPADGFFGSQQYHNYDAVLAMYHDQGLIPFKSLSFGTGVNYTAGLPVIRTSPDHGTAYALAGKNKADESSFRAALFSALDLVKNRQETQVNTP